MRALELKIPPPVVAILSAGLMWIVASLTPGFHFSFQGRGASSLAVLAAGLLLGAAGTFSFGAAKTTVNPLTPAAASSLVTSGIYRFTRNPMYLGMLLDLLAYGIFLANPLTLVLVPAYIAYLNRFQIGPEEKALYSLFGQAYLDYKSRVRRWV
jgi:protein-S-isoprenylcysteine O-methyltransferase Ste14